MRLIIISGSSGSGKSTALHVLEDMGFICIDNLPASLLPNLVERINEDDEKQYAVSIDARNSEDDIAKARPKMIEFLDTLRETLEELSPELGVTDPYSGTVVIEK